MTANSALYNLNQGQNVLNTLEEQVSSGLNVNEPSDDPLTTRQLLGLQNQINAGVQSTSNITGGTLMLNVTNTALGGMMDIMSQVKTAAGSMSSGSTDANSANSVTSVTNNLAQLKAQLIDLGNTQNGNQYVFGGFTSSPPFDAAGTFSGTNDPLNVAITPGTRVSTNVAGGSLLRGGTPPAAVGTGTTAGTGPVDILGSIDALITAISTNNTTGIADGIKNMSAASDQITAAQSDVAGRLTRLANMQSMITNNQNTLEDAYSNKQNVDLTKAGVELSQQTTAFNASLAATAKITQLSLLNYMT
jgi:flagellar hook-associated protein 3 FlgL